MLTSKNHFNILLALNEDNNHIC